MGLWNQCIMAKRVRETGNEISVSEAIIGCTISRVILQELPIELLISLYLCSRKIRVLC